MVLGRKRLRRRPARVGEYPDDGPCLLQQAWTRLSRIEFAVWCRLASESETINLNKHQLAKLLELSKRRLDEILRGLHHKGFLVLVPAQGAGAPMRVTISRKPAVYYDSSFVNVHHTENVP